MEELLQVFKEIGNLPKDSEAQLISTVSRKNIPVKTILQEAGRVANQIYFVEKGISRTFYYKDGKDITYWIAAEGDFVGSMASFFSRKPGNKYVETLEDCILWEFDYPKLEKLFDMSVEFERAGRLFANHAISLLEKRFDDLHFNSAKERYNILIDHHPQIIQRVSLGIIASYLGITQETLSRIRNQS